jgi:hypothetical protein
MRMRSLSKEEKGKGTAALKRPPISGARPFRAPAAAAKRNASPRATTAHETALHPHPLCNCATSEPTSASSVRQ